MILVSYPTTALSRVRHYDHIFLKSNILYPIMTESSIVYSIPCSCGEVYIGETTRRLEQRVKEHQDACKRGNEKVSAIVEHAWQQHHPIKWEGKSCRQSQ